MDTQSNGKVVAIMPAYNAAKTLEKTVADIPHGVVDEIILVDDASSDNTVEIAKKLGLSVYVHSQNQGYGANQKTCYRYALEHGADYIIMIHPDYQYDSRLISVAVTILRLRICDVVLGARVRTRRECLKGGMPVYKYLANRFLTFVENMCLGQNLADFHSGFRAYRREVLEVIAFERNDNDFVFDTQFLIQAVHHGFVLGDIPMPVRYFTEASSIKFFASSIYGLKTLLSLLYLFLHRLRIFRCPLFIAKKPKSVF